jgi:hypothetical protein
VTPSLNGPPYDRLGVDPVVDVAGGGLVRRRDGFKERGRVGQLRALPPEAAGAGKAS